MKTIIKASKELTKVEQYVMMSRPDMIMFKQLESNTVVNVTTWCLFEDDSDEDITTLLTVLDNEGKVYCAQSKTFINSFLNDIAPLFPDEPFEIIKIDGKTKAGRDYINCILNV